MPLDQSNILLSKAREDEHLLSLVVNIHSVSDEQIGFFCQQSVEKAIKAVLARHKINYRRTHDLTELVDLLRDNRIAYPLSLDESPILTPFATEMRYDYLPPEQNAERPFDRSAAVKLVRSAIEWAEAVLSSVAS